MLCLFLIYAVSVKLGFLALKTLLY